MNRVKKVSRKWEEQRDDALRVHSINRAATNMRRRRARAFAAMDALATKVSEAHSASVDPRGTAVKPEEAVRMLEPAVIAPTVDDEVLQRDSGSDLPVALEACQVPTLRAMAKQMGLSGYSKANKQTLITMINDNKEKAS